MAGTPGAGRLDRTTVDLGTGHDLPAIVGEQGAPLAFGSEL